MKKKSKNKKSPERMCAACREMRSKEELFRIALAKDGEPVYDESGKAAGRGAYLCKSRDCLMQAERKHLLARSLHHAVSADLFRELEACLGEENDTES